MQKSNRKVTLTLIIIDLFVALLIGLRGSMSLNSSPPTSYFHGFGLNVDTFIYLFSLAIPTIPLIYFAWQLKNGLDNNSSKLFRALTTLNILSAVLFVVYFLFAAFIIPVL